jgi:hypothetical protein
MSYGSADLQCGTDSWKQVDEVPELAAPGTQAREPACKGNRGPLREYRQSAARELADGKWCRLQDITEKGSRDDPVAPEIDERHALRPSEDGDNSGEPVAEFLFRRRAGQRQKLVVLTKDVPTFREPPEREDNGVD